MQAPGTRCDRPGRGRHRREGLTRDTALGPPAVQRVASRPRASVQLCAPAAVPDRGGMILAQSALRLCVSMFADGGGYPFNAWRIPRFLEAMAPVEALLGDAVFRRWKVQE